MAKRIPLVLLPGTLCDERLWKYQMESLADIADLAVANISNHDTLTALAEEVLSEAPQEFALAGLSLGGMVALEIMRIAPERVLKLALLDTNPYPPRPEQKDTWNNFFKMIDNNQFMDITKKHLLPVLIHPDKQDDEATVLTILQMAEAIGEEAYVNQLKAVMSREDQRRILSSVTCPVMIMVGKDDVVCPVPMSEYMASQIPHATLEIIEDAGHLITLEQPENVSQRLKKWLLNTGAVRNGNGLVEKEPW
ncbi:alpha/beta fold hydrolase [Sporosarcina sp. Marseille-Q4943]|uniref:alpha/beta fold hydrolase n=1 Tax=Sporosarcina sp. Marseille-Q4943 TaxID=2942204 RepID=UPI00208DB11F|nr:alpha/beta hydrolase [Sporosarcina sp. Marseille-Q4943]